jgi:hypothetical protein
VTGVSGGTTTANGQFSDYAYQWNQQMWYCANLLTQGGSACTPYVQVPTSLRVVAHPTISMTYIGSTCNDTSSYYGIDIAVQYQVLDQSTQPINGSIMEPQEEVLNLVINGQSQGNPTPNWTDIGPSNYPGTSQYTNSSGQFYDAPQGTCSNGAVVLTKTQKIRILMGGTVYPVRTNNWTVSSSSGGHGSINNGTGGDISNTR